MNRTNSMVKGDCEVCDAKAVELTLQNPGNIMMCADCVASEKELTERNRKFVEDSRKTDALVELKQDIFNAATVPFVELQAAIEANNGIPADKKAYALAEECASRIDILTRAIFADEQALIAKRNERHAWLVNTQNVAARLHESERTKFKQYDINYKPQTPKSVKPKAVASPKSKKPGFDKAAVYAAAAKYGVPAAQVQAMVVSRHMTPEAAAQHMAKLMGLI